MSCSDDLLAEFRGNYRAAREGGGASALTATGISNERICGHARVTTFRSFGRGPAFYEPTGDGNAAVIVPAFTYENGSPDVYDLIAVGLNSGRSATRRGLVQYLGERSLDVAWVNETPARVFLNGLEWLAANCCGLFLVDTSAARWVLGDVVTGIRCSSEAESKVLHEALQHPLSVPPIFVEEGSDAT